jgi:hypothetical protein
MDTDVGIVRTHWAGTSGGPGISQFAFAGDDEFTDWNGTYAQTAVNAVRAFWNAGPNYIPNEITLTIDPVVDIYSIVTGALINSFTAATPPATVAGTSASAYMMAAGFKVVFNTATIANGRRVKGGVFVVPCASDTYGATGLVQATPSATFTTAANTMRTTCKAADMDHIVWSRPTTKTSNDGGGAVITGYSVPTKGSVLRGRRD